MLKWFLLGIVAGKIVNRLVDWLCEPVPDPKGWE